MASKLPSLLIAAALLSGCQSAQLACREDPACYCDRVGKEAALYQSHKADSWQLVDEYYRISGLIGRYPEQEIEKMRYVAKLVYLDDFTPEEAACLCMKARELGIWY